MAQRVYSVTVYTRVKLNFTLEKQLSAVGVSPHMQEQYTLMSAERFKSGLLLL